MKELAHCKRLSAVKTNAGVKFLSPAAFPGNHCPLHTALALSSNVKGMSTLVVGTAECGTYSRNVIYKSKHRESGLHWVYVLDANEVVFGCRKGLMQTIKEMDKAGAKAIMLILTCVPEIIGEDAEGIVHELSPQVDASLSFVQMGHFKCNSHPSGFWKTLEAFADLMQPAETDPRSINVLGRSPGEEHIPMPFLLTALEEKGFQLRLLAPKSEMEDFMAAPSARLNLVLSPYMNPLAERMYADFGVPFLSLHEVYATNQWDEIFSQLGAELGVDWDDALFAKQAEAKELEEQAKAAFGGLTYATTPRNALMPLPLAKYLVGFGMEPLLLHMEEFYPDDRRHAKELVALGQNPQVCHMVNDGADAAVLERLEPDIVFGEIYEGTGKLPAVPFLYEMYGQCGYERTAQLLKRTLQTWQKSEKGGADHGRSSI